MVFKKDLNSYDYRPNWTPLAPITIIKACNEKAISVQRKNSFSNHARCECHTFYTAQCKINTREITTTEDVFWYLCYSLLNRTGLLSSLTLFQTYWVKKLWSPLPRYVVVLGNFGDVIAGTIRRESTGSEFFILTLFMALLSIYKFKYCMCVY